MELYTQRETDMTTDIARRRIRVFAATAVATVGLVGLAACAGNSSQHGAQSGTGERSNSSTAAPHEETSEDTSVGDPQKCDEEQVATLSSASGVAVPPASLASANAEFSPASVLGDLKTVCAISFQGAGVSGGYAVLPGGDATLTAAAANARAAGAKVTEAAGTFTGSVEGVTVVGVKFSALTQETAGFENTEDLIVITAMSLLK
jgi:hypothetical protein